MLVFISHASEDAPLAVAIKDIVRNDLDLPHGSLFVSSEAGAMSLGDEWVPQLREKLSSASAMLVLCGPRSIGNYWIAFEAGCCWLRRKPVIPICHSGLTTADLPLPFSMCESIQVEAPLFHRNLEDTMRRLFDLEPIYGRDYSIHRDFINNALAEINSKRSDR